MRKNNVPRWAAGKELQIESKAVADAAHTSATNGVSALLLRNGVREENERAGIVEKVKGLVTIWDVVICS